MNMRNKTILRTANIAVLATIFLYIGCGEDGDNGVQPSKVSTFVDSRDGRTYKKVQIGKQIWMAENLKFAADNSICYGYDWRPNYDSLQNCEDYGRLYDWNTAMDNVSSSGANPSGVEGVCPVGWHLPSDAEWRELTDFAGENAATRLKSRDFHGTRPGDAYTRDGIDMYGFGAMPTGAGSHNHTTGKTTFMHFDRNAYWWTSTETMDGERAHIRMLQSSHDRVMNPDMDKHRYFLSVRCVHD